MSKNLPSIAKRIKDAGVEVEVVTDMLRLNYVARFTDPDDNAIQISCDNIVDDNGESFDVSMID